MKVVPVSAVALALTAGVPVLAGLEGWWRFVDEGPVSSDLSGNGRDVSVDTNRVARLSNAPGGGAVWFDGMTNAAVVSDGYAYVQAEGFENAAIPGPFTVSGWIYADEPSMFAPILFRTADPDEWSDGFGVFVDEGSSVGAFVRNGGVECSICGGALYADMWNHVALTYTGSEVSLYVNGLPVAHGDVPEAESFDVRAPLEVGTLVGTDLSIPYSGAIADVRFWSHALSAQDIDGVYRQFLADAVDEYGDDDCDGMDNAWEIRHGLNPKCGEDASRDEDGDGLSNLVEWRYGCNPRRAVVPSPVPLIYSATITLM